MCACLINFENLRSNDVRFREINYMGCWQQLWVYCVDPKEYRKCNKRHNSQTMHKSTRPSTCIKQDNGHKDEEREFNIKSQSEIRWVSHPPCHSKSRPWQGFRHACCEWVMTLIRSDLMKSYEQYRITFLLRPGMSHRRMLLTTSSIGWPQAIALLHEWYHDIQVSPSQPSKRACVLLNAPGTAFRSTITQKCLSCHSRGNW